MNYLHIGGTLLHKIYLTRRTWFRLADLFYWTLLSLFLWGLTVVWLNKNVLPSQTVNIVVLLLGALIFWELFWRVQQGVAVPFLEDVWAHNVINVFASPLTLSEFIGGFVLWSIVSGLLNFVLAAFVAWILYALNIFTLGFYLIPFVANIFIFGWALGFITIGLIIRFGPSFEILAWSIPVLFQPLSAVFYPLSTLPVFFQKIAFFLPTMHLFEGMRTVLLENRFPFDHMVWGILLSILFLIFGLFFLYWMIRVARKRGSLSRLVGD